jgi:hypothetical protein
LSLGTISEFSNSGCTGNAVATTHGMRAARPPCLADDIAAPSRTTAMKTPHALKRIILQLARSKEFPSGSARYGYDLVAPLDVHGHIDPESWRKHQKECRVRRFWGDEEDAAGLLVHKPGGAEHARWMFDYAAGGNEDEEAGYRFGMHTFAPGEYVSIRDHGGELHTFKVTSVEPLGS